MDAKFTSWFFETWFSILAFGVILRIRRDGVRKGIVNCCILCGFIVLFSLSHKNIDEKKRIQIEWLTYFLGSDFFVVLLLFLNALGIHWRLMSPVTVFKSKGEMWCYVFLIPWALRKLSKEHGNKNWNFLRFYCTLVLIPLSNAYRYILNISFYTNSE